MSVSRVGPDITLKAADGSVTAYRVVTVSGVNQVDVWQTATSLTLGVAQDDASATNDAVGVRIYGTSKATCGESISSGSLLTVQTDTGKILNGTKTYNTGTTAIPRTVGISLQAGSTNAVIEIVLFPDNIRKQAFA